ncbi:unnamed protein product [Amoebophrya sp. A120]|nr:unnamed protein product [Amoebophrya sp. A120]|eukprot:GSA120T00013208001.1
MFRNTTTPFGTTTNRDRLPSSNPSSNKNYQSALPDEHDEQLASDFVGGLAGLGQSSRFNSQYGGGSSSSSRGTAASSALFSKPRTPQTPIKTSKEVVEDIVMGDASSNHNYNSSRGHQSSSNCGLFQRSARDLGQLFARIDAADGDEHDNNHHPISSDQDEEMLDQNGKNASQKSSASSSHTVEPVPEYELDTSTLNNSFSSMLPGGTMLNSRQNGAGVVPSTNIMNIAKGAFFFQGNPPEGMMFPAGGASNNGQVVSTSSPSSSDSATSNPNRIPLQQIPVFVSSIAQTIFNSCVLALGFWALYSFYAMIRDDIQTKVEKYSQEILDQIEKCSHDYTVNKCGIDVRPALEQPCRQWQACMDQDPLQVAYKTKFSAATFGEALNGFFSELEWKTIVGFPLLMVVVLIGFNMLFGMMNRTGGGGGRSGTTGGVEQQQYHAQQMQQYNNQNLPGSWGASSSSSYHQLPYPQPQQFLEDNFDFSGMKGDNDYRSNRPGCHSTSSMMPASITDMDHSASTTGRGSNLHHRGRFY